MSQTPPVTNPIPSVLTNAKVYKDGVEQLGVGTVEVPSFEYLTNPVSGLGIAGTVDMPIIGHFKALILKIKWNMVTPNAAALLQTSGHHIEVRGSIQELDAGSGQFLNKPVKIVCKAVPKKSGIGKFESGTKMESETELEVYYIKMWMNGQELLEIDKFNFIFKLNGDDKLSVIRSNLGM